MGKKNKNKEDEEGPVKKQKVTASRYIEADQRPWADITVPKSAAVSPFTSLTRFIL